jgi:LysM repeat protein
VVQPGDTLSGIADRMQVPGGSEALYAANRQIIGTNPNRLEVGQTLARPGTTPPAPGDTAPPNPAPAHSSTAGQQAPPAASSTVVAAQPGAAQTGAAQPGAVPSPAAPGKGKSVLVAAVGGGALLLLVLLIVFGWLPKRRTAARRTRGADAGGTGRRTDSLDLPVPAPWSADEPSEIRLVDPATTPLTKSRS